MTGGEGEAGGVRGCQATSTSVYLQPSCPRLAACKAVCDHTMQQWCTYTDDTLQVPQRLVNRCFCVKGASARKLVFQHSLQLVCKILCLVLQLQLLLSHGCRH